MAAHAPVTIYTIGHSRHARDEFVELLRKHSIQVLVDVRSHPQSRRVPHFNQKHLETAIPKAGIDYKYFGNELGGLPEGPAYWKSNPRKRRTDPPRVVDYTKVAQQNWFQDAVTKLIEVASEHRTAIMCSEENPANCHRSLLVGDALAKNGVKVLHIRKDGTLETQPPT